MAEKVKIKTIARYGGHSVRTNGSVDITFKFEYGDLSEYIKTIQMLNENVGVSIKRSEGRPEKLGTFMVKNISVDHDGEGTIKFNSMVDQCDAGNMHTLYGDEPFKIMLEADIEESEEE